MCLSMSLCVLMPGAIGLIYLLAVLEVGDGVFEVLSTSGDTHLGGDDFDKVCIFSFLPTKCCCDLIEQSNSKPLVPARGHSQSVSFMQRIVDWLASDFKKNEGIDLLKDKQALQRLTETAEKAKMELSSLTQTNIRYVQRFQPSFCFCLFLLGLLSLLILKLYIFVLQFTIHHSHCGWS